MDQSLKFSSVCEQTRNMRAIHIFCITFGSVDCAAPYFVNGVRKLELCSTTCLPMLLCSAARSTAYRGKNEKGCPETVYDTVITQMRFSSVEYDCICEQIKNCE